MFFCYNINLYEVVFIDDSFKNVEGSEVVGIKGIYFINVFLFKKEFIVLGIVL